MAHIQAELDREVAFYDRRQAVKWELLTCLIIITVLAAIALVWDFSWADFGRAVLGSALFRAGYWILRWRRR